MDPLACLLLRNKCMYESVGDALRDFKRARDNKVEILFLKRLEQHFSDEKISQLNRQLLQEYTSYITNLSTVLNTLNKLGIRYVLLKHSSYPHVSVDADILFLEKEDYQKALPIITKSKIRIDPHVGGLREYKALNKIMPAKEIWENAEKVTINSTETYVPSNEYNFIIRLLHMLKHREIYLGDLIEAEKAYINSCKDKVTYLCAKYNLMLFSEYVNHVYFYFKGKPLLTPEYMLLDSFTKNLIRLLSLNFIQDACFPLKIPRLVTALSLVF